MFILTSPQAVKSSAIPNAIQTWNTQALVSTRSIWLSRTVLESTNAEDRQKK